MSKAPKSPYERAKKYSRCGKCTVDDLRKEIQNEFKKRLKDYRSASVDRNRYNLEISRVIHRSYREIRESLLSDEEAIEYLDQNNLFNLLDDVQEEILNEELQREAEDHERDIQREFDSIIEDSVEVCSVCDRIMAPFGAGVICRNCVRHFEDDL